MSLIKCVECGKEISDKASNCIHCGCPIITEEKLFCKECGNELNINDRVCNRCGCPIKNETLQQEQITFRQNDIEQQKPIVEQQIESNKSETNSITKKGNPFLNIIRYLIGSFFLTPFIFGLFKGLGIVFNLVAVLMIFPFSANFIYKKISMPKILKIFLPIILMIISIAFFSSQSSVSSGSLQEDIKIFCSKSGNIDYSITLTGNNKITNVKGVEEYSSSIICAQSCKYTKTLVSGYADSSVSCGDDTISYKYVRYADINDVANEFKVKGYVCK